MAYLIRIMCPMCANWIFSLDSIQSIRLMAITSMTIEFRIKKSINGETSTVSFICIAAVANVSLSLFYLIWSIACHSLVPIEQFMCLAVFVYVKNFPIYFVVAWFVQMFTFSFFHFFPFAISLLLQYHGVVL